MQQNHRQMLLQPEISYQKQGRHQALRSFVRILSILIYGTAIEWAQSLIEYSLSIFVTSQIYLLAEKKPKPDEKVRIL